MNSWQWFRLNLRSWRLEVDARLALNAEDRCPLFIESQCEESVKFAEGDLARRMS